MVSGSVAAGFEHVAEVFSDVLAESHGHGAGLHIRLDGTPVVDLWGGHAREDAPWHANTPSVIFSCTKGLVSILMGELVKDGRLELDAPMKLYWPEFSGGGKDAVTVRAMLAHRAGLPFIRQPLEKADIVDWERMVSLLEAESPQFEPDTTYAYHAFTFGWLAGELIRRITRQSVGTFLQERITRPLHADAWIGMDPTRAADVATVYMDGGYPAPATPGPDASEMERLAVHGSRFVNALPERFADPGVGWNDPDIRRAELPGVGGIASARALGTIWSATVSDREAVRLLSPDVIGDMRRVQSIGAPGPGVPPPWPRWGTGFMLSTVARPFLSPTSFGHDGFGGQVAFADEDTRLGFGFVTNDLQTAHDDRAIRLVDALKRVIE